MFSPLLFLIGFGYLIMGCSFAIIVFNLIEDDSTPAGDRVITAFLNVFLWPIMVVVVAILAMNDLL